MNKEILPLINLSQAIHAGEIGIMPSQSVLQKVTGLAEVERVFKTSLERAYRVGLINSTELATLNCMQDVPYSLCSKIADGLIAYYWEIGKLVEEQAVINYPERKWIYLLDIPLRYYNLPTFYPLSLNEKLDVPTLLKNHIENNLEKYGELLGKKDV